MEGTRSNGQPSEFPPDYVAIALPEGVVIDQTFVERTQPSAMHSEEMLEGGDSFLSVGSETWDYHVTDGCDADFVAAVKNSQLAIECARLDE